MAMEAPWLEKYRPERLDDVLISANLREQLRTYPWKKPLLLHGSSGSGKTLLVNLLAKEGDFILVPIDGDNLDQAEEISGTTSLFGNKKLMVCDSVEDIKKIKALSDFLKKTTTPTIVIASDIKSKKLKTIKKICEKIQIRKSRSSTVAKFLAAICQKEDIVIKPELLERIAESCNGDIRAAILDLESLGRGKKEITATDLETLKSRDSTTDIYKALNLILIKDDLKQAYQSIYNLDEKPDNVLLWVDENLPKVFSRQDLKDGFYYLSRADVFLGRIYRRQYWGFLRYANSLMTAGVNTAKTKKVSFVRYHYPFYIIHLSQTRKLRSLKRAIAKKLSSPLHASSRVINREYLPLIALLLKNDQTNAEQLSDKFKLTDEEIDFLRQ